jgi:putative methionine-R-sulfoxide reductase with GAF domain
MHCSSGDDALHVAIEVPFGVGIAGAAAEEGKTMNVVDAYGDPRFNRVRVLCTSTVEHCC